ncbi:MAG: type VI secretion system tip protein VgrG [Moraxellaceae bacterium]|nr:MAG: type VI secretion system tip protein VgrG [Moraxellaceae bacterium]
MMQFFNALLDWALNPAHRAITVHFSDSHLNQQVFLQRISGSHMLNEGLNAQLLCVSDRYDLPLKQFIGLPVAIDQRTDHGQCFRTSGIITAASQGDSDGTLTAYTLTLQDPTALWHKRRNSRVFMNKSVVEISQLLFKEWQTNSSLFAQSLTLETSGLSQPYDTRPFVMQCNETDYEFLTRLWRSEGINWLIDEAQLLVASPFTALQPQQLRLIDDNRHFTSLPRHTIDYHLNRAVEQADHISHFTAQRQVQPSTVHLQHWQPRQGNNQESQHASLHQHSNNQPNASLSLEQAFALSPAWVEDLTGSDGSSPSDQQQLHRLSQNLRHYYDYDSKQFIAKGSVRDVQTGYWFALNRHPEIDSHAPDQREFLITQKQFYQHNNLPKDLSQSVDGLLNQRQGYPAFHEKMHQGCTLRLVRRSIPVKPDYNPLIHTAKSHPQRARVVGAADESIHVDEWGRIKVQFLFTRAQDYQHSGGAGSSGTDQDSAWVDVLTPWAGDSNSDQNYGARFLPRVGELVVIGFFEGNADRPFVMGRLHEGSRLPTQFDHRGTLPQTRALSGIKSQEVDGSGFNQLRLDDTSGQISAQLHSSHGASQLNLGNLSHPKQSETSVGRGEGFELRTDQFGAVRAGQGLLISTHIQQDAKAHHLDAQMASAQLTTGLNGAKALSELAGKQHTDPLDTFPTLESFLAAIKHIDADTAARFEKAVLLLTSPNGIALTTPDHIILQASENISSHASGSINLSTQSSIIGHASDSISLFAAQQGIKAFAAKGKLELQAQGDNLEAIARKNIRIISTEDRIEITSPKEMVVNAGGSQLMINASGVFIKTGGKFESKAGQHVFMAGQQINVTPFDLPKHECNLKNDDASSQGKILLEI